MFLRAVYSLGESSDSSTVVFRTTPHGGRGAEHSFYDSENKDRPPDDSSDPECRGDGTTVHSVPAHSVACPVSEKGDNGSGTFPARQLSQKTDVRSVSTFPLGAGKTVEKVRDQSLVDPSESLQPDTVPASEDSRSSVVDDAVAVAVRGHSQDEPTYVPKPPDESVIPRRNSFTRRGSLRRQADSRSTQHTESKDSDETGSFSQPASTANLVSVQDGIVAKTDDLIAKNAMPISGISPSANKRTRSSSECSSEGCQATQFSKSSPEDLVVCRNHEPIGSSEERQSSSLGAVRTLSHGMKDKSTIADKPPAGRRDSSMDCCSPIHSEDDCLRRQLDKADIKAVSKNSSPSSRIPQQQKQDDSSFHKMKKLFGHRR